MLDIKFAFTRSFSHNELQSVSTMLLYFQELLLNGPSISKGQTTPTPSQAALTISELIMYNAVKQRSNKPDSIPRHIRERENPLVIYVAIKVYSLTRKESIVDSLHSLGLCISYSRLRTLSTDLANSILKSYEAIDAVVPVQALHGVFTVNAYDIVDHNP